MKEKDEEEDEDEEEEESRESRRGTSRGARGLRVVAAGDTNDISSKTCSAPPPGYGCSSLCVHVYTQERVYVLARARWAVYLFAVSATKPFCAYVLTST